MASIKEKLKKIYGVIKKFIINTGTLSFDEENEYVANKYLSQSLMIIDLFLAIFLILISFSSIFQFPVGLRHVFQIIITITIIIVLIPCIFAYFKGVKNKNFKYIVLGLLLFVIALMSTLSFRHTILIWAVPLVFVLHYYDPKISRRFFYISIALLLIIQFVSLLFGSWDSGFFNYLIKDPSTDTIAFRWNYLCLPGDYGWPVGLEIYFFYTIPNALVLFIIYSVCRTLSIRTQKLTMDIKEATAAQERLTAELSVASNIQYNNLPTNFPADTRIDLYAIMHPAKNVGGDFYDFYYLNSNKFLMMVADVSDKGVPAALFMMKAKTIIDTYSHLSVNFADAVKAINNQLCDGNDSLMFVTAWIGILEIDTGRLQYVNAGHNFPIIKRANGATSFLKEKPNCFLGVKENIDFTVFETTLNKGDEIFLYTDGVNEYMNNKDEQFGNERLLSSILNDKSSSAKESVENLHNSITAFANGVDQSDDITILALKYVKEISKYTFTTTSKIENITPLLEYINNALAENGAKELAIEQIDVAIDELFSNIVKFAYSPSVGDVSVTLAFKNNKTIINIFDCGKEFNPLAAANPKLKEYKNTDKIGGLGIYIVKKTMDDVRYQYLDGMNVLSLFKTIK